MPPGAVIAPTAHGTETAGSVLARNLDALGNEGDGLRPFVDAVHDRAANSAGWTSQHAAAFTASIAVNSEAMKPLVVEGLNAEMVLRLMASTPPRDDTYSPRVVFVEPDAGRALGVLSADDLTVAIGHPRFRWFLGPGATNRLHAWLGSTESTKLTLPDRVVRAPGLPPSTTPATETVLAAAAGAQSARHEALRRSVSAAYTGRSGDAWQQRFESGQPLRVLVPISRYSTFVRHSAEDLAGALRRAGHETLVLTEPDAHSRLSTPAYLDAFETFRPDLVVLINFTRKHMAQAVPAGVPFVCWVQDRMAHLFDPAAGAAQGDLDFLIGHLHADLFEHFGYPRRNRLFRFVPACSRKFHDGPVEQGLLARLACDVAYASHQSETPEAFHRRTSPMFGSVPQVKNSLESLRHSAEGWMNKADADPAAPREPRIELVRAALGGAGLSRPDERLVSTVFGNYLVPLMERMLRHRTLEWASRVCERRGWSLRLYGRGWEAHPVLARYAAGPLDHDAEALRAVYRAGRVNLHLSLNTNSHQRVAECALSGGLMIRRGPSPDWELAKMGLMRRAADGPATEADGDAETRSWTDVRGTVLANYWHQRGIEPVVDERGTRVFRRRLPRGVWERHGATCPELPLESMPDYSHTGAHETLFSTETELERLIERSLGDAAWRTATVESQRSAALAYNTYDEFAGAMLALVGAGLTPGNTR